MLRGKQCLLLARVEPLLQLFLIGSLDGNPLYAGWVADPHIWQENDDSFHPGGLHPLLVLSLGSEVADLCKAVPADTDI